TDLGNVLTYNPPVDFNYSTVYYVTLTPYNTNGTAVGCTETSFTTRNAPPAGSTCSNPIVINPLTLPYTTTDNTNLYGDDYENGSTQCSSFYMSGDDVVYTITPPTNMSVDIVLSNLSGTYSGIHVLDGCPNSTTPPACIAFAGNSGTTIRDIQDVLLTGGVTYYIVISTWAAPQSTAYTLTITQNTCVNPTVSFSAASNCPTTNFNAVANITNLGSATSLTVSDNQGSTPQVVTATGNVSFGPFAFGTNVVLTVVNNQDTSCSVTSSNLTIAACPPANDECANAIVLTPGAVFATNPLVGTNAAATGSTGVPAPGCALYSGGDVWYQVTIPASGSLTIETNNNSSAILDTGLAVYSGTCGALVLVECDDDDSADGNFSLISLTGRTLGEVLFVRVWEYGNDTFGTFQVSAYDASLSSGSFDNANFSAYPNPVKDVLNVSYSTEISSIRVINMIGQEVISKNINATSTQVDMSQLSAGTYIVNVTVGDNVKTLKVVKQ
ncbi:MAG: T9SS type A sorting domain-containing protein, partial [Bacteroidia bacterium]